MVAKIIEHQQDLPEVSTAWWEHEITKDDYIATLVIEASFSTDPNDYVQNGLDRIRERVNDYMDKYLGGRPERIRVVPKRPYFNG